MKVKSCVKNLNGLNLNFFGIPLDLPSDKNNRRKINFFVSDDEYRILGNVELTLENKIGVLSWLYVIPEYRKKGIGKALIDMAIRESVKYDYDGISLIVGKSKFQNELIKYYRKLNFFISCEYDDESVCMTLKL